MARSPRRLYLIRHAIAAERGPGWPDDGQRPLTKRGAQRLAQVMNGFAQLGESIDLILTSPLVRAVQTAGIVADGLGRRPPVRVCAALAPGYGAPRAADAIATASRHAHHVALVGHEPDLGQLAAWLIGAREPLPFKKGGICRIDTTEWPPDRSNRLVWLATPKMLKR